MTTDVDVINGLMDNEARKFEVKGRRYGDFEETT